MRGTKNKNRQQIQDETDRLKAQINVSGGVELRFGEHPDAGGEPGRFAALRAGTAARALVPRSGVRADPPAAHRRRGELPRPSRPAWPRSI